MTFIAWPEIEQFNNIRKFLRIDPTEWWRVKEQFAGTSTVFYKCKVKLHGTNAAVQILPDGTVLAQSRTGIITPENDNAGFARWVKANEAEWRHTAGVPTLWKEKGEYEHYLHVVFFGEWCGPGIQKGVALAEIPKKCFAVFAMRAFGKNGEETLFEVDPNRIAMYLGKSGTEFVHSVQPNLPDVYILPWFEKSIDIDWKQSDEELSKTIAPINDWVAAVEANDPWVESNFGVKGTGEGLVFYPVSKPHREYESFQNLVFKAKGEAHKNIKTAAPVQVSAEAAASIDAFVELVLTTARLGQGAATVGGFDVKNTGKFVAWVSTDVEKEAQDELEASNLTWKQVQKPLSDKARAWYLAKAKQ